MIQEKKGSWERTGTACMKVVASQGVIEGWPVGQC